MTIQAQISDFIIEPTAAKFLALRTYVLSSGYHPYSGALRPAREAWQEEGWGRVLDHIFSEMPNLLVCPFAHKLASTAFRHLGDPTGAESERRFYHACLDGIFATGDGSPERPYRVMRAEDKYEVLGALDREPLLEGKSFQARVWSDGEDRRIEAIAVKGGGELCFDLTDSFEWLRRTLGNLAPSMADRFAGFVLRPHVDDFVELRRLCTASSHYKPYSETLSVADRAASEGSWQRVRDLEGEMPDLLLSPRAHDLLRMAYEALGEAANAAMFGSFYQACMRGILASGDGSVERPYMVLRHEDEYDVLCWLGRTLKMQSLIELDGRAVDEMLLDDGSTLYFDITESFVRAGEGGRS
ncbi:MAG: DUF4919 domain-containing protein [Armatimonadetes bacterium]|nr:DUF4919 domain-containing protein [Armatimonadota bacterium]